MGEHSKTEGNPWTVEIQPYGLHYAARFRRRPSVLWTARTTVAVFAISLLTLAFVPQVVAPKWVFAAFYLAFLSGFILVFFGLTFAWNIWGEERYTFTSKAIVRQHHYGIWTTAQRTFPYGDGSIYTSFETPNPRSKDGVLCFWSEDEHALPQLLTRTAIPVPASAYASFSVSFSEHFTSHDTAAEVARWN